MNDDESFQNIFANSEILPLPSQNQNHLFSSSDHSHSTSLLYNLSLLKQKIHQIHSVVDHHLILCNHQIQNPHQSQCSPSPPPPPSTEISAINSLLQDVIMAASSMLFTCQQMTDLFVNSSVNNVVDELTRIDRRPIGEQPGEDWYNNTAAVGINSNGTNNIEETKQSHRPVSSSPTSLSFDIIELNASDLLAKYTHYCQICGKGFKRDANLRMHMRAHGDEYKTNAALCNPKGAEAVRSHERETETECNLRRSRRNNYVGKMKKYSCPQEGCRWNKKHEKFQPLKSLICVKNHYKRTHCPKMYVCKRCHRKQFSVLSDLKTHEKHCGDVKWMCSCGTTFSRKDKLMGHLALFLGHAPAVSFSLNPGKFTL